MKKIFALLTILLNLTIMAQSKFETSISVHSSFMFTIQAMS